MVHCEKKTAAKAWQQHGVVKLSWLAINAITPLDFDDERHRLDISTWQDGTHVWRVINIDGSVPEVHVRRVITKEGTVDEGQFSEKTSFFNRLITPSQEVQTGVYHDFKMNGPGVIQWVDGEV